MPIPFTQYLRPFGHPTPVTIERPAHIERRAQTIIEAGYRFECEVLQDGSCSFTITDEEEGDLAIELAPNGPAVLDAIDRLVENFNATAKAN